MAKVARALISVYDKSNIVKLGTALKRMGVEILSTGGTASLLRDSGIDVTDVSAYTGSPEILDGRLKTLHPKVHGGILGIRDNPEHQRQMKANGIGPIDMVVVNLYPFESTIAKPGCTFEDAIENIDIGGPAMVRAASKNHQDVAVVVDPSDYAAIIDELDRTGGELSKETKFGLAKKAFALTAHYDSAISRYLASVGSEGRRADMPSDISLACTKVWDLRYGENPHQKAAFYRNGADAAKGIADARQLQGKDLSYNNILDADAVLGMMYDFLDYKSAAVIAKHNNPCGIAVSDESASDAFAKALACDKTSAFGGIVGVTVEVDGELARALSEIFFEVIIAPSFSAKAKDILAAKKNLRLLEVDKLDASSLKGTLSARGVLGGMLVQGRDVSAEDVARAKVVTKRNPTGDELDALEFAWRVCKHVKSNAIVFAAKDRTLGIGAGQMSRVDSAKIAIMKAGPSLEGSVVASDAFFPFRDGVDVVASAGAKAIVEPGGSMRDDEVIAAADEHGIAMVFTGVRHFRH
jgi:phosphoribosylaminoimidazolecarboxamide formyltransferase/IMP cyclohydrolase